MTYRGKFMSRAARLAHKAEAGSFLATDVTWRQAQLAQAAAAAAGADSILPFALVGRYKGAMSLKGVPRPVQVYDCSM